MGKKENLVVVADRSWYETVPEWLKEEVRVERLSRGLGDLMESSKESERRKVGLAEVTLYLYTLSLRQPLGDLSGAYVWCVAKVMTRRKDKGDLPEILHEKLEEGLTSQEEFELNRLRRKLYEERDGKIQSPLLNAMRDLKRSIFSKKGKKEKEETRTLKDYM